MKIAELLAFAHKSGASDAHITSGEPPRVRVDGDIKRLKHEALSPEEVHTMVFEIMSDAQQREFEETNDIDFSFSSEMSHVFGSMFSGLFAVRQPFSGRFRPKS
jgi:twitching motility protein PilT